MSRIDVLRRETGVVQHQARPGVRREELEADDRVDALGPWDHAPSLDDALVRHELDIAARHAAADETEGAARCAIDLGGCAAEGRKLPLVHQRLIDAVGGCLEIVLLVNPSPRGSRRACDRDRLRAGHDTNLRSGSKGCHNDDRGTPPRTAVWRAGSCGEEFLERTDPIEDHPGPLAVAHQRHPHQLDITHLDITAERLEHVALRDAEDRAAENRVDVRGHDDRGAVSRPAVSQLVVYTPGRGREDRLRMELHGGSPLVWACVLFTLRSFDVPRRQRRTDFFARRVGPLWALPGSKLPSHIARLWKPTPLTEWCVDALASVRGIVSNLQHRPTSMCAPSRRRSAEHRLKGRDRHALLSSS